MLEPGVDDKAFQINVITSHRLEGRPSWEDQGVGETETITDPHWTDIVRQSQGDSDITTLRSRKYLQISIAGWCVVLPFRERWGGKLEDGDTRKVEVWDFRSVS